MKNKTKKRKIKLTPAGALVITILVIFGFGISAFLIAMSVFGHKYKPTATSMPSYSLSGKNLSSESSPGGQDLLSSLPNAESSTGTPSSSSEKKTDYIPTGGEEDDFHFPNTPLDQVVYINEIAFIDGIMLANKTYSLPQDYDPGGLLPVVKTAFTKMENAAVAQGYSIWNQSGYRSYASQLKIYNNYVARDGVAAADRYSARAGHSEHQTGMVIDLNTIDDSFGQTREAAWVAQNAHIYGFIVRYPQGKEDVTGYKWEPWHIRYVGIEKAAKLFESGLTIEEYYGITSVYDELT